MAAGFAGAAEPGFVAEPLSEKTRHSPELPAFGLPAILFRKYPPGNAPILFRIGSGWETVQSPAAEHCVSAGQKRKADRAFRHAKQQPGNWLRMDCPRHVSSAY